MKLIRNFLDRIEPDKKSSPFLHTLWDGFDTFLYAPALVTKNGVHIRDGMDLKRTMIHVVLAMQLAFIAGVVNIGHQHYTAFGMYGGAFQGIGWKFAYGLLQMLPLIIVVHVVGLGIEFFFAAKKGHSIEEGFLVSAFLIPMIMPPDVPLWMVAIATAFAVIVAKEAFGGTGMNILNIALTARVFVFFAYPSEISGEICWISYDYNVLHSLLGIKAHTVDYLANLPNGGVAFDSMFDEAGQFIANSSVLIDGWSGATPLGLAANGGWSAVQEASYTIIDPVTNKAEVFQQYSTTNLLLGVMPGSIG
ncbi:MAG TPA: NADH:ubiquinone reductase (Na(+)-transporting) subunit B, partial [Bacteroidetes bacterium]|nr:NADH:ubiquinone reductase (Na(+)-transporting) subunit B [Bacteroidota bacterium]